MTAQREEESVMADVVAPPSAAATGTSRRGLIAGLAVGLVVLLLGLVVPHLGLGQYGMSLALNAAVLSLLALGIGFLARRLGLISLGHTAFFGGAAYAVGIGVDHFGWNLPLSVLFAVVAGTVLSLVMGVLVVRASGMGFLMLTLALSQALYELTVQTSARPVTGAYDGLPISFAAKATFLGLTPRNMQDPGLFWPLVWVVLVVCAVVIWLAGRSRFGTVLEGIRENEERMRFSGYNTFRPRLAAFVLSGCVASIGGALFALNAAYVSPDLLGFTQAGDSLIAAMVGGLGTLAGPVVGTAIYVWGQAQFNSGGNLHLFTGIALIVVLVFLPGGITGQLGRAWNRFVAPRLTRGGKH